MKQNLENEVSEKMFLDEDEDLDRGYKVLDNMTVDQVLSIVGGYKRWHLMAFVLLGFTSFGVVGLQTLAIIFIGFTPEYYCSQTADNSSIFWEQEGDAWVESKCRMYTNISIDNSTDECKQWTYSADDPHTIVSQYDLVCSKSIFADTSQTIYKGGALLADIFGSYLTDRFGRKKMHLIATLLAVCVGTAVAFANNFITFSILRVILGFVVTTAFGSGFVLLLEIFHARLREFAAIASEALWVAAYLLAGLIGYLAHDWRHYQLSVSIMMIIVVLYIWIMPESPLWLAANNQHEESEKALKKMAKWNGVKISAIHLKRLHKSLPMENGKQEVPFAHEYTTSASEVKVTDLITDFTLRKISIISCLLWFTNFLVYFFLVLSSPSLAGDRFVNYFLGGVAEIPGYMIAYFVVKRFGRRLPTCILQILTGVFLLGLLAHSMVASHLPNLVPLAMVLALLGKMGVSATVSIILPYTKEMIPTNIRGIGGGIYNFIGQIGCMIAPLLSFVMRTEYRWAPMAVCAALSIGVGLLILILPETTGKPLPQTLHDVHSMDKTVCRKHGQRPLQMQPAKL